MSKKKQAFESYHKKFDQFYQSVAWRKIRAEKFASENGMCEHCRKKGIVREGVEVHHILPIDKCWEKRLDFNNLVLLCADCHNKTHGRESALQKFNDVWEELMKYGGEKTCNQSKQFNTASEQQRVTGARKQNSDLSESEVQSTEVIDRSGKKSLEMACNGVQRDNQLSGIGCGRASDGNLLSGKGGNG